MAEKELAVMGGEPGVGFIDPELTRFSLVNPATGEVYEYEGEPADVYGFIDNVDRQIRFLKDRLRHHFEHGALLEKEKGLLSSNTFYFPSRFGRVKVTFFQDIQIDEKRAAEYEEAGAPEGLVKKKVTFSFDKNMAKEFLKTVSDTPVKRLIEEDYTAPLGARASFEEARNR